MYIIKIDEYKLPDISGSHLKVYCKTNIHDARIKFFEFKLFKYLYDSQSNSFHAIKFDIKTSQEKIHKYFLQGLNQEEIMHQKLIFGDSDLDIKVDSLFSLGKRLFLSLIFDSNLKRDDIRKFLDTIV